MTLEQLTAELIALRERVAVLEALREPPKQTNFDCSPPLYKATYERAV